MPSRINTKNPIPCHTIVNFLKSKDKVKNLESSQKKTDIIFKRNNVNDSQLLSKKHKVQMVME